MVHDPKQHRRRSIRLRGYDYAQTGLYFVTICTQDRSCHFGEIVDGVMIPTLAGIVIEQWWHLLPMRFRGLDLDAFVVMPNHIHGIGMLGTDAGLAAAASRGATGAPDGHANPTLSHVVQWFKSITTTDYRRGVTDLDWPPCNGRLWQRNDYEHIIRTDAALARIRAYVAANPANWDSDAENPAAIAAEHTAQDMRR